jgi:hypothetical protein
MAARVLLVVGVAGDQDPGHRPITGQALTGQEAVQVHGDRELGPDPTRVGEPPSFQGAEGQLGKGSSIWPASGSNRPSTATIPAKVGASQSPRRA